ncbi:MAG: MFS transporter [Myxococcales bacterium]|nr:MFS transporter [Myxococcales bacterium]
MATNDPASSELRFDAAIAQLRDADFRRLFAARLVSPFGSQLTLVAMAFGVLGLTGEEGDVGVVLFAFTASYAVTTVLGGALADRWDRRRLIVAAEAFAGVVQTASAALLLTGRAHVWQLALLMAANGAAFGIVAPAVVGLIPLVVERRRLQSANALLSVAHSSALLAGGAAAGWIVAFAGGGSNVTGAGAAIALDAASFFATAALVARIRPRVAQRPVGAPDARDGSMLRDLREGFGEFVAHRWLWTIVAQWTLVLTGYLAGMHVVGPIVAERRWGGPLAWGGVAAALGAGLLVGGLVAMRVAVRRPMLVGTCFVFAFAAPLAAMALDAPVAIVAAAAFAAGLGNELFAVLWYTALHTHVAPDKLSRVSAWDSLGSVGLAPLGQLGAGFLVGAVGLGPTLGLAVALVVVPTALVLLVPEVRRLESAPPREAG